MVKEHNGAGLYSKLWLYTNFHCNLRCSYCVAESTPGAEPRSLSLEQVQGLVDEGQSLGFRRLFLTGGEPLVHNEIFEMLAYASERLPTTVLTNAMLLKGKRWQQLQAVAHDNLTVQVSLDGATAAQHDAYRGQGSWAKTVDGIRRLLDHGFHVCVSTTETRANSQYLDDLRVFRRELGIGDEDHLVRPLARRGFSDEGLEVGTDTLQPEPTVTVDGVYWHPLVSPSDEDMLVSRQILPLAQALSKITEQLACQGNGSTPENGAERQEFT